MNLDQRNQGEAFVQHRRNLDEVDRAECQTLRHDSLSISDTTLSHVVEHCNSIRRPRMEGNEVQHR